MLKKLLIALFSITLLMGNASLLGMERVSEHRERSSASSNGADDNNADNNELQIDIRDAEPNAGAGEGFFMRSWRKIIALPSTMHELYCDHTPPMARIAAAAITQMLIAFGPYYLMKNKGPLFQLLPHLAAGAVLYTGLNRKLHGVNGRGIKDIAAIAEGLPFAITSCLYLWKGFWGLDNALAKTLSITGRVTNDASRHACNAYFKGYGGLRDLLQPSAAA